MVSGREMKKKSCITSLSVIEFCITFHPNASLCFPILKCMYPQPLGHVTWSHGFFFLAPVSIWTCFVHSFLLVCCLPTSCYNNVVSMKTGGFLSHSSLYPKTSELCLAQQRQSILWLTKWINGWTYAFLLILLSTCMMMSRSKSISEIFYTWH